MSLSQRESGRPFQWDVEYSLGRSEYLMNRSAIIFNAATKRADWCRGFLDEHRVYRAGNDLRRSLAAFDLSKDTRNLRCIGPREPRETSDRRLYVSHTHLATGERGSQQFYYGREEGGSRVRRIPVSPVLTGSFFLPHAINSKTLPRDAGWQKKNQLPRSCSPSSQASILQVGVSMFSHWLKIARFFGLSLSSFMRVKTSFTSPE